MRYSAPADVSGITLSTGQLTVVDGFVEVPDDASEGDRGGLAVYGFTPAPDAAPDVAAGAKITTRMPPADASPSPEAIPAE
jgi:hypothetical protein